MDHSIPTTPRGPDGLPVISDAEAAAQLRQIEVNCQEFGVELQGFKSE